MTEFRAPAKLNAVLPKPEARGQVATSARKKLADSHADVTIIGAGVAGLTAGALLAKDGFKVQVLERDIHPGGCAASFRRQTPHGTFRFAVGATVAAGLEPGGILHSIYNKLGLHAPGRSLERIMRVHLNAQPVEVAKNRQAWTLELERAFPGQQAAKQHFWRDIQSLADTMHHVAKRFPVMPFKSANDLLDTARGVHPGAFKVLMSLGKTVGQLLEQHAIQDPAHKAFIDGQLLDSMQVVSSGCALPNGAYALEVYRFGAQYVPGGLSSISDDFAKSITDNGGSIHYATRAREILTEKTVWLVCKAMLEPSSQTLLFQLLQFQTRSLCSAQPNPSSSSKIFKAKPKSGARLHCILAFIRRRCPKTLVALSKSPILMILAS